MEFDDRMDYLTSPYQMIYNLSKYTNKQKIQKYKYPLQPDTFHFSIIHSHHVQFS